ncbi:hypothetical protein H4R26_002177 [Coemansia thaxteri]|uniref:Homologous recombination OB-fold protein OB-fold domain-containing protein n=1 Tax=Coemansia thaxteri TaxID=2663907 RepID=A0A9W8BKA8_9FUNG|nr:hypothetical protein H4R26_002177 [Coemansia thaxteri]KAJ2485382.1 hypothetical protein EV174_001764 [Coemansia sp. RSA 2320]
MSSALQDALNRLREAKDAESSVSKRHAAAGSTSASSGTPQPISAASVDDMEDLDFDLDDADAFGDLMVNDTEGGNAVQSQQQRQQHPQQQQQQHTPARTAAPISQSVPRLAGFAYTTPAKKATQPPPPQTRPSGPTASLTQQSSSSTPQTHQAPALPRSESTASNARSPGQNSDFLTTVVQASKRRAPSLSRQKWDIPGPAGLVGEAISCSTGPTQGPAPAFKAAMSRRVRSGQSTDVDFEGGTWAAMLEHLGMPPYRPSTAKSIVSSVDKAGWPISRVLGQASTARIPAMLVQLREMGGSETDASVVVVDPTGEMRASVHQAVMRRVALPLAAGTSIILQNVVAMKLPASPPFLVITGASIEQIFAVKSAGTYEDPIVVPNTQDSIASPTRAPRAAADGIPRMPSLVSSGLHAASAQPAIDLDADVFSGVDGTADDMLDLLQSESFGDDDTESI